MRYVEGDLVSEVLEDELLNCEECYPRDKVQKGLDEKGKSEMEGEFLRLLPFVIPGCRCEDSCVTDVQVPTVPALNGTGLLRSSHRPNVALLRSTVEVRCHSVSVVLSTPDPVVVS